MSGGVVAQRCEASAGEPCAVGFKLDYVGGGVEGYVYVVACFYIGGEVFGCDSESVSQVTATGSPL